MLFTVYNFFLVWLSFVHSINTVIFLILIKTMRKPNNQLSQFFSLFQVTADCRFGCVEIKYGFLYTFRWIAFHQSSYSILIKVWWAYWIRFISQRRIANNESPNWNFENQFELGGLCWHFGQRNSCCVFVTPTPPYITYRIFPFSFSILGT